jgi:mRNA interferase RelE/StbE
MNSFVINIKDEILKDKVLWLLEHFKNDGLEIVSREDLDDLKLLKASREDETIDFEEYLKMKIVIRSSAIKDLKSISEPFKTKIEKKILELKKFPNLTNIKKLTNFEPAYRYRIGDYRVLLMLKMII